jgi:hypothetical protein
MFCEAEVYYRSGHAGEKAVWGKREGWLAHVLLKEQSSRSQMGALEIKHGLATVKK